mmetsp:Transcript_6722/g.20832  ORF Transcript_6722/g.20832 Transcript_6722/m.20832 type:complete len:118 (+) Transcript_6722:1125-1478(+)
MDSGLTPYDAARYDGHTTMAAWLARVGWTCYLSEPRYNLVVLRALAARGLARRRRADSGEEQLLDFLFPGQEGERGDGSHACRMTFHGHRYYWWRHVGRGRCRRCLGVRGDRGGGGA